MRNSTRLIVLCAWLVPRDPLLAFSPDRALAQARAEYLTVLSSLFQSTGFGLALTLAALVTPWVLYSVRLRQTATRLRADIDFRLAQRERIARELHDRQLQGFQGLILRFQSVANRIPRGNPLHRELEAVLDCAEAVLIEGRESVRDLRSQPDNLATRLADLARNLATASSAKFTLTTEGEVYRLETEIDAEVQRIAGEAIRNAFRHASAGVIEAVLTYRRSGVCFQLVDNGAGLPADVTRTGSRVGYHGLTGMRERAARLGGSIAISTRSRSGTEIMLKVPYGQGTVLAARTGYWSKHLL